MKLKKFLNEEKLDKRDIFKIDTLIDKPSNTVIVLKSFSKQYDEGEREVEIKKKGKNISFAYNMDFYELGNVLVDICDNNGYKFKTDDEKAINTTTFTVIK